MRKNIPAYQSENMALFVRYIPDKEAFEFSTIDSALDFIMGNTLLSCTQRFCERRNLQWQNKLHRKPCMK